MAVYLEASLQEEDSAPVATALGNIARGRGICQIARDAELGRESLYYALPADGNPEFETIMKALTKISDNCQL